MATAAPKAMLCVDGPLRGRRIPAEWRSLSEAGRDVLVGWGRQGAGTPIAQTISGDWSTAAVSGSAAK